MRSVLLTWVGLGCFAFRFIDLGRVGLFCVPFYSLGLSSVVLRSVSLAWIELGSFAFRFIHMGCVAFCLPKRRNFDVLFFFLLILI